MPKAVSKKKAKTPKDPGNKLFTKCPAPKAAFCLKGTLSFSGVSYFDIIIDLGLLIAVRNLFIFLL